MNFIDAIKKEFKDHRKGISVGAAVGVVTAFVVNQLGVDLSFVIERQGLIDVVTSGVSPEVQLMTKVVFNYAVIFATAGYIISKFVKR